MTVARQVIGALATVSSLLFVGVAVHEINYRLDHPHAYGPAVVIAVAAVAGALVSVAVAVMAYSADDTDWF